MRKFITRALLAGVPLGIIAGVPASLMLGTGLIRGLVHGAIFGLALTVAVSRMGCQGGEELVDEIGLG